MARNWKGLSKLMCMPQRYILGIMGALAVVNAFTMRNCISVALTEMVLAKDRGKWGKSVRISQDKLFDWDENVQGLILSSFYWGYVASHIPGGMLAEKFGGKYTLSIGLLATGILTIVTPVFVELGDWPALVALRIMEGLAEGTTFPAVHVLLAHWVPSTERGKIGTIVFSGAVLGSVAANIVSGLIIDATNTWASPFYFFGCLCLLWLILFDLLCYSRPLDHPFISDKELSFLNIALSGLEKVKYPTPWIAILSSLPVWAGVIAQIGHDWGLFAMTTTLPKYMQETLNFSVKQNGIWSSVPYILMWIVAMINSGIVDWLIVKNYISTTAARKLYTTIGAVAPGVFIIAASYAGTNVVYTVAFFTVAMGTMGFFYAGVKVNALDLTTNFTGTVSGLINGIGAISGIITPSLIGLILSLGGENRLLEWRLFYWITLAVLVITSIFYILFASGEIQLWNIPSQYHEKVAADKAAKAARKTAKAQGTPPTPDATAPATPRPPPPAAENR